MYSRWRQSPRIHLIQQFLHTQRKRHQWTAPRSQFRSDSKQRQTPWDPLHQEYTQWNQLFHASIIQFFSASQHTNPRPFDDRSITLVPNCSSVEAQKNSQDSTCHSRSGHGMIQLHSEIIQCWIHENVNTTLTSFRARVELYKWSKITTQIQTIIRISC